MGVHAAMRCPYLALAMQTSLCMAAHDAWTAAATWLSKNGGYVHHALHGSMTSHGGKAFRGVVTSQALWPNESLIHVPKHMWMDIDTFQDLKQVELGVNMWCSSLDAARIEYLKNAVGMALETKKGEASFFAPYLRYLPKLDDYKEFYPRYMTAEVARDFRGLPLVRTVQAFQEKDEATRKCFESWKLSGGHLISTLTWQDVLQALSQFRTRVYGLHKEEAARRGSGPTLAIVPVADLLNTEKKELLNTEYQIPQTNNDFLVVTNRSIARNGEVYDSYCMICNNEDMMSIWGVYLDTNQNRLLRKSVLQELLNCTGESRQSNDHMFLKSEKQTVLPMSLFNATMAMLDVKAFHDMLEERDRSCKCPAGPLPHPTSPRDALEIMTMCSIDDFQNKQGVRSFGSAFKKITDSNSVLSIRAAKLSEWNYPKMWNTSYQAQVYNDLKAALSLSFPLGTTMPNRECESNRLLAPRCKESSELPKGMRQIPLRCSLARLAWEYCSEEWGFDLQHDLSEERQDAPSLLEVGIEKSGAKSSAELASLYDQSARHALHPRLHPSTMHDATFHHMHSSQVKRHIWIDKDARASSESKQGLPVPAFSFMRSEIKDNG